MRNCIWSEFRIEIDIVTIEKKMNYIFMKLGGHDSVQPGEI